MMLSMLRLYTAGDSHGVKLTGILEGLPSNLRVDLARVKNYLKRRRVFKGRSNRQMIEKDEFQIISGVEKDVTTGSPIACEIKNHSREKPAFPIYTPRPGHADFSGFLKYQHEDIRPVIERASARETAIRTCLAGISSELPISLGIKLMGFTERIGNMEVDEVEILEYDSKLEEIRDSSDFYFVQRERDKEAEKMLKEALERKETLGGAVCIYAFGVPPGLGSYVHWERRIDSKIAAIMLSIPSVRGVEIGDAIKISKCFGKESVDEFSVEKDKISRKTNYQGGIEGGMTNGMPIKIRLFVKPIPTQLKSVKSFNLKSRIAEGTKYIRSDICVVPAISVIGEVFLGLVLCDAILEKFGSDNFYEIMTSYERYMERLKWM